MTAPTIHSRVRIGTPLFDLTRDPGELCNPTIALIDRFQVRLELPISFPNQNDRDEWVEMIADQAIYDHPLFGPNVSRGRGRAGRSQKFKISGGWHFSGGAELRLDESFRGRFVVDLSLNFTRWLNSQDELDPAVLAQQEPERLLRRLSQNQQCRSLDGKDNVLSGRDRVGSPTADPRVQAADALMEVYIAAVEGLLTDRIVPAHGSALPDTMSISSPRLQSASSAEVYFEFYADDAVSTVEGLRASAIRATENPVWRDFIGSRIEGGLVMNAPYISIPLTKTVQLVIYAKQSRLLRLEVRYSEDIREHAFHRRQRGTSRTLSETLRALKHDAASRLTQLLRGFAMHLTNTNGRCDLLDLLDAIGRVTERNPARARELLAQLVNFGGVTQTDDDGIAPARVIRRLERDGVLTRHSYRHGNAQPGAPRYALSPPYSGMIEHLVAEADGTRPPAGTTMN